MSKGQFPSRLNDLIAFVQGFDGVYMAHPERYLASPGEAASVHSVISSFITAAGVAAQKDTRTHATITLRQEALVEMMGILRPTVRLIMDNVGIDPADKEELGLKLPDTTPSIVAPPTSAPVLDVVAATPLEHLLKYHDQNNTTSRAKPVGTNGMQLVRIIATTPPVNGPVGAELLAVVTRQPYIVRFAPADATKIAYYWARWQNPRGEPGPWSAMASMVIAGVA